MNILITAATDAELLGLNLPSGKNRHSIKTAVHGVGILMASFHLQKLCQTRPDLIIQLGIAGTYRSEISLGQTVLVHTEVLGDAGAEDGEDLLSLSELGFVPANDFPFTNAQLVNPHSVLFPPHLKSVTGLTVNLAAGSQVTIDRRRRKFSPDIETMEGAVLHFMALQFGIPFIQFRGISNIVEPRNRANWQVEKALQSCHQEVSHFIQQLA